MDSANQFILRREPEFALERRTLSNASTFRVRENRDASRKTGECERITPIRLLIWYLQQEVERFMSADRANAFDLTNQRPLVRFALLSLNERDHFFLWSFHSILFDRYKIEA